MTAEADAVWSKMVSLVFDGQTDWKRQVVAEVGMPFSRVRVLRRLVDRPLTLKGLAEVAIIDAPAATVNVNDLERRGLVERTVDPGNGRVKLVSITPAGRDVVARVAGVQYPAPRGVDALTRDELAELALLLDHIADES